MASFKQGFLVLMLGLAQTVSSQNLIDQYLEKYYILTNSSKFDKVLIALGVDLLFREAAEAQRPIDKLSKFGDQFIYTSLSPLAKITATFAPGVPFNFTTADGRNVTSTITISGATLHEVQVEDNGRTTTIDRIFSADQLKLIIKVGHVVAIRMYELLLPETEVKPQQKEATLPTSEQPSPTTQKVPEKPSKDKGIQTQKPRKQKHRRPKPQSPQKHRPREEERQKQRPGNKQPNQQIPRKHKHTSPKSEEDGPEEELQEPGKEPDYAKPRKLVQKTNATRTKSTVKGRKSAGRTRGNEELTQKQTREYGNGRP